MDDTDGLMQTVDAKLDNSGHNSIKKLKGKIGGVDLNQIYSSSQDRALQTANLLFPGADIQILDYIHEYIRPKFLNGVKKEKAVDFWENINKENKYGADWKYDGSESFVDIVERADKFLKFLYQHDEDDSIAVIGHGVFFRHFIGSALLGDDYNPKIFFDLLLKLKIGNCGYIKINLDNRQRKVLSWEIINN